jgi:hypothetical protein
MNSPCDLPVDWVLLEYSISVLLVIQFLFGGCIRFDGHVANVKTLDILHHIICMSYIYYGTPDIV